ncbi:hypothetical protein NQ160_00670 [Microbacterium sp. zg.Y909]|nr:hypothetical protein [Microbacterium sp. zg.Y909]
MVLFAPSGVDAQTLARLAPETSEIVTIGWSGTHIVVPRPSSSVRALDAILLRTPAGRALRRLSPVDPGAAFFRATLRSVEARDVVARADLLIADERDGIYAAWRWARRRRRRAGAPVPAVVGLPAGRARIARA